MTIPSNPNNCNIQLYDSDAHGKAVNRDIKIFRADYTYKGSFYFQLTGVTGVFYDFYPNLIDLTEIFGAGNEPTSAEQFKKMFPNEYYPYHLPDVEDDASGLTLTSSYGTISQVHMARVGKLVNLEFLLTLTSVVMNNTLLVSGAPSASQNHVPIQVWDITGQNMVNITVNPQGVIYARQAISNSIGHELRFNATYITE